MNTPCFSKIFPENQSANLLKAKGIIFLLKWQEEVYMLKLGGRGNE